MTLNTPHTRIFEGLVQLEQVIGAPLFIVGGYVRDLLLKVPLHDADIDVVIEGDASAAASIAQSIFGGEVKTFSTFGTAKLVKPSAFSEIEEIDFAACRKEIYPIPGALPTVSQATLTEDLKRRDFTINAIAARISHLLSEGELSEKPLIDPFGGKSDLSSKKIRILHEGSFIDDPTRLFRAVRYCVRIEGSLEQNTESLFNQAVDAGVLNSISLFRIFSEIRKMCDEDRAVEGMEMFTARGLLSPLLSQGINLKTALSGVSASENRYTEFLKSVFKSLPVDQALLLARELNISKKTVNELRS